MDKPTRFPMLTGIIDQARKNDGELKDVILNHDCLNLEECGSMGDVNENYEQQLLDESHRSVDSNNSNMQYVEDIDGEYDSSNDVGNAATADHSNNDDINNTHKFHNFDNFDLISLTYYTGLLGEVLRCNTHVTTVYIYWDFIQYLTDESKIHFLLAIASIPNLKHLHMFLGDTELSISYLMRILKATNGKLETFDLNDVILEGTETDFDKFNNKGTDNDTGSTYGGDAYKGLKKFGIQNLSLPSEMNLNPIMHALSGLNTLEEIQMDHIDMQDQGVSQEAIQEICEMPKLRNLTLDTLELTQTNNKALVYGVAEGLMSNTTALECLTLSGGIIDDCSLSPIADALKSNNTRTLEKLHLTFNSLGCNSFYMIEDSLKMNTNLKVLGLDGNDMVGPYCDTAVANVLKNNSTLTEISLTNNKMENCIGIANALADNNTTLERLFLSYNHLNASSGMAIANALRKNKTLKILTLVNNPIGIDSCMNIANSLKVNDTLEELYLDHVCLPDRYGDVTPIATSMIGALEHYNCAMKVISVDGMEIQPDELDRMNFFLELNQSGRNDLLRNDSATRTQWVDQLVHVQDDLDQIFYWIRSKPSLLATFDMRFEPDEEFYIGMPNNKRLKKKGSNNVVAQAFNSVLKHISGN